MLAVFCRRRLHLALFALQRVVVTAFLSVAVAVCDSLLSHSSVRQWTDTWVDYAFWPSGTVLHISGVCVCICACALTCAGGQKRVLVFSPGVELQGCESHDIVAGDGTSQPLQVRQLSLAAEPSPAFSLPSVVLICISLVSSVAEHLSTHGCPCCVLHRTACSYRRSFLNRITLSFCWGLRILYAV